MRTSLDILIQDNLGLLHSILHKYNLHRDPEAESIAYEYLWKACVDYDESLGYKRSTLITVYIKRALNSYLRKMHKIRQIETVYYSEVVDNTNGVTMGDILSDGISTEDLIFSKYHDKEFADKVYNTLRTFKGKKIQILEIWLRSDFEYSYTQIASMSGVTQSYVSQTIAAYSNRMRIELKEN